MFSQNYSKALFVASVAVALSLGARRAMAGELNELPVTLDGVPAFHVSLTPVEIDPNGGPRGACPEIQRTYTNPNNFQGGTFNLQGGMVETEIAAASYVVNASEFPLRIGHMEMIIGTQNATVQTVTQWSVIVWAGTPSTGTIVATYSSDDEILPHARVGPGTAGVKIDVSIDPNDPEQIFVSDNGSHTFSVGFRIDDHNNEPTTICSCGFGNLPAVCCPPQSTTNAFFATDTDGLANASNNWLFARSCPGATGLCALSNAGWHQFGGAGLPSGDWVLRASYTPINCPGFGACCTPASGSCQLQIQVDCENAAGVWQGEGSTCTPNPCPQPTGACCRASGVCEANITQNNCAALNETFHVGIDCELVSCQQPNGACCMNSGQDACFFVEQDFCVNQLGGVWQGAFVQCGASTCVGACCFGTSCLSLPLTDCNTAGGTFQGIGATCAAGNTCPQGACCLPSGSCVFGTQLSCSAQGGVYQGTGTACGSVSCPQPSGACCLSNGNCLLLTQGNCSVIPGANWAGMGTTCPGGCQPACDPADGDMNGDGSVDAKDIPLFTTALLNGGTQMDVCHGDFNGSSNLDVGDINGMVAELLAGP